MQNIHKNFNIFTKKFNFIKTNISSPNEIKNWAEKYFFEDNSIYGKIENPNAFNEQSNSPTYSGLYCPIIFGPIKNWCCGCGKYMKLFKELSLIKACEICKVEISTSKIRKYRMGYIELILPQANVTFLENGYLLLLLNIINKNLSLTDLTDIIYYKTENFSIDYTKFNYEEYSRNFLNKFNTDKTYYFNKKTILETFQNELKKISHVDTIESLRNDLIFFNINKNHYDVNYFSINKLKQLRILESFHVTKICPSWLILTSFPVLPPALRAFDNEIQKKKKNKKIQKAIRDEKKSDEKNQPSAKAEAYQTLLILNILTKFILFNAKFPLHFKIIFLNQLQKSVDYVLQGSESESYATEAIFSNKLQSLSETFEGKKGRFRQTLLGKRVDYSGRTVIIPGPNLTLNQCGLPFRLALDFFKNTLYKKLKYLNRSKNFINDFNPKYILKKTKLINWILLNKICQKSCVILNRAPTLHKYSLQAFNPVLITGLALELHPLICTGLNADFDGDQIGIHLSLSKLTKLEAYFLLRPSSNLLNSSNGQLILKPTQEIIIGSYYLTMLKSNNSFSSINYFKKEAVYSLIHQKQINLQTSILVSYPFYDFFNDIDNFFEKINALKIYKICKILSIKNKIFLLTNYGILILKKINKKNYKILEIILETTPGQLIFERSVSKKCLINL